MTGPTAALLLRIGRRSILRSRWRSLLIVVLILVPVAGMVGLATVVQTITPTAERSATDHDAVDAAFAHARERELRVI